MKRIVAIVLTLGLLTGCAPKKQAMTGEDLMEDIKPNTVAFAEEGAPTAAVTDFAVRLLRESAQKGKNTLVSPLSVLYALSMTANGADANTLAQMESVLGEPVGVLNSFLGSYQAGEELHLANGIWYKDDPNLTVEQSFLQTNADYYKAGIYKAPFDETTLKDINSFVEEHTHGMVKDILDKIPEDAVMYLVNALAFDGKWEDIYKENQVHERTFTTEDGVEQEMELMYSQEGKYLEDENATGFIKYYAGRKYAFAALLPKEGVSVSDYVQSLTGEHLQKLLGNAEQVTVNAAIPKFETAFDTEMSDILKTMGMSDAFDSSLADFSKMATCTDGNIYISRVLHKTFISVAEQGTKAGAATVIEAATEGAIELDIKRVTLDRPFVYMILDTETNTPIFMGTLVNMGEEDFLFVEPNENGHTHIPAEDPGLCAYPTVGYCGNIVTTVKLDGKEYSFMYDDSVALTDILTNQLTYDPDSICRCMADITVETELGGPYYVNLEESFVRCDAGQAALTEEQLQRIRQIIENL